MNVFTYGTLRTGGPLHRMMEGAESLGPAETVGKEFAMIDLGYFPGVVREPHGYAIKGELFEGDNSLLDILDRVEGVPTLYTRDLVPVICDNREYMAWVYLYKRFPGRTYKFNTTGEWNNGN